MSQALKLSERIQFLPVMHGSGMFAREISQQLLSVHCDCLAVALPPEFKETVEEGVDNLPRITLSCQVEIDGGMNYVPIDPSQSLIMGLRIAMQESIPRHFIGWSTESYEKRSFDFPDSFSLNKIPYEKFVSTLLLTQKRPKHNSQHFWRTRWMAYQLHQLEIEYSNVVFICSILDWPWVKEAYDERLKFTSPCKNPGIPVLYSVDKQTLFFALTELPYVTYLYEKKRQELRSGDNAPVDGVKEILLRARDLFVKKHKVRYHNLTSQTFQFLLQYIRNLTLMESRLLPDLYTLVNSAKQFGGDAFAIEVLEAAREYPYNSLSEFPKTISLGIDQALLNDKDSQPISMKNRLSEYHFEWRTLNIKPEANIKSQEKWEHHWDPHGQCSWPPEDEKIENLNIHVREQTKLLLSHDLARTEKFTSSVKDGIDIRDTLRHWYGGDIYVKEIPPSRGQVEIIVLLFDVEPEPQKYTWCQTWYAENNKESTLCFFATQYKGNLVGPGIGKAIYGGCMMIYPPRAIPDIWQDKRINFSDTLEERLLEAAFFHSREKHITVVSPCEPRLTWRRLAQRYSKKIIHIPLKRFSNQTIEKVRQFHVLNGKNIRSYAQRFIQDL
jgi:hypothetical protein